MISPYVVQALSYVHAHECMFIWIYKTYRRTEAHVTCDYYCNERHNCRVFEEFLLGVLE